MNTIKLTIQEIVNDFESIIRFEEHITTLEEIDQLDDENSVEFLIYADMMIRKYIPNYENLPQIKDISSKTSDKQKAMILSNLLQENFKEIFYGLI